MPGLRPWGAGPYGVDEWPAPLRQRDIAGASVTAFILEGGMARAWIAPLPCETGTWRVVTLTEASLT